MASNTATLNEDSFEIMTSSDDRTVSYSPSSSEEDFEVNELKYIYDVTEFDYCRLKELDQRKSKDCMVCPRVGRRRIKTRLVCLGCNLSCCIQCYDTHRREQMVSALRKFRLSCPDHVDIRISDCGGFLEAKKIESVDKMLSSDCHALQATRKSDKKCATKSPKHPVMESRSDNKLQLENQNYSLGLQAKPSGSRGSLPRSVVNLVETLLKKKYSVSSELWVDNENHLKCLYFQDEHMKDIFNFYPERICIDVTCKLMDLDIAVFLLLCEDSNGQSEIISVCLVTFIDEESLLWLFNIFKKHNPNWRRVKIVIADPHITQRDVVKRSFPNSFVMICFYHAIREFSNDLESESFISVPEEQKKISLELFESMLHASNENQYDIFFQQFQVLHCSLVEYFVLKWHHSKLEWTVKLQYEHENLFYAINNFLDFVDSKLKPVINAQTDLCEFLRKFFFIMSLMRSEKRVKVLSTLEMVPISLYSKFTPHYQITRVLTPYAADFVIEQLNLSAEINSNGVIVPENYVFCNLGSSVTATAIMCSCKFFTLTVLPCCHIFAVRRTVSLSVFDEAVCDVHWTDKYYRNTFVSLRNCNLGIETDQQPFPETQEERFRLSSELTDQLLTALLKSSQGVFDQRIVVLNQLMFAWKDEEEAYLCFDGGEDFLLEDMCDEIDSDGEELIEEASKNLIPENLDSDNEMPLALEYPVILHNRLQDKSACEVSVPEPKFRCPEWNFNSKLLDGDKVTFVYLLKVICHSKESCTEWLRFKGFIPSSMVCPSCGSFMTLRSVARLTDGAIWVCKKSKDNKKGCDKRCTVRRGTWLASTNMTMEQILMFTYMWIHGFNQQQVCSELGISSATYLVWSKFAYRVCEESQKGTGKSAPKKGSGKAKVSNVNNPTSVGLWLQKNAEKDLFMQFLKDAALVHELDCAESSGSP